MLHPLAYDLAFAAAPLVVATALVLAGRTSARWPRWLSVVVAVVCFAVLAVPLVGALGARGAAVTSLASRLGGVTTLEALLAVLLFAIVLGSRKRRMSGGFLAALIGVASVIVVIESCSTLFWRFGGETLWRNRPDVHGHLQQTTGMTCAAASGAMLLWRAGIESSEGDVAYLAGTSPFGTDQYELA